MKFLWGDEIKEDEMGGACSRHWKKKGKHTIFLLEIVKRRYHLEDLGVDGNKSGKEGGRV
jgi:hypothetical protein